MAEAKEKAKAKEKEKEIGEISNFFEHVNAAAIKLKAPLALKVELILMNQALVWINWQLLRLI